MAEAYAAAAAARTRSQQQAAASGQPADPCPPTRSADSPATRRRLCCRITTSPSSASAIAYRRRWSSLPGSSEPPLQQHRPGMQYTPPLHQWRVRREAMPAACSRWLKHEKKMGLRAAQHSTHLDAARAAAAPSLSSMSSISPSRSSAGNSRKMKQQNVGKSANRVCNLKRRYPVAKRRARMHAAGILRSDGAACRGGNSPEAKLSSSDPLPPSLPLPLASPLPPSLSSSSPSSSLSPAASAAGWPPSDSLLLALQSRSRRAGSRGHGEMLASQASSPSAAPPLPNKQASASHTSSHPVTHSDTHSQNHTAIQPHRPTHL